MFLVLSFFPIISDENLIDYHPNSNPFIIKLFFTIFFLFTHNYFIFFFGFPLHMPLIFLDLDFNFTLPQIYK